MKLKQAIRASEVRKRIELALNPAWVKVPRIPVEQARARQTELVDSFVERASTWSSPEEGDASSLPPVEAPSVPMTMRQTTR
jgi:hypothetical protein